MMKLDNIITSRYSVRKYSGRPVDDTAVEAILNAGRLAPTAANRRQVRVIAARSQAVMDKIAMAANTYAAPLCLIVCANAGQAWVRPFDGKNHGDIDATIVTDHMLLKATEMGLGSVWICHFDPDVLRRELEIPEELTPVNILAIGWPAADSTPSPSHSERLTMDEFSSRI